MQEKNRVIRDPIYGYIQLPDELTVLVDHPLYQRLRRVGQTSLTSTVYPTATGSRFEHGLGAMHLAMWGFRSAWNNARGEETRSNFIDAVRADSLVGGNSGTTRRTEELVRLLELAVGGAALLHDLGHPPFSHVLEPLYEELAEEHFQNDPDLLQSWRDSGRAYHEFAGSLLTKKITRELSPDILRDLICAILNADENGSTWSGVLHAIVAGEVDVDRLDYIMRDARNAGTEFGAIDYTRLLEALELHGTDSKFRIAAGLRARSAVETLLLQRTQAYKWIIFHPRVVGANLALAEAMELLRRLAASPELFGPDDSRRPAEDVFAPRWPDLNYLMPSEPGLLKRLASEGDETGHGLSRQLQLNEQQLRGLVERLGIDMQASIDDGTVTEALKGAGIVAETLLTSGAPSEELRRHLSEFLTFQQHALMRARNCIPVWKTVDEFDRATAGMRDKVVEAVRESYRSVIADEPFAGSDLVGILSEECEGVIHEIRDDPATGINKVIAEIFDSEPRYRRQFAKKLAMVREDLDGVFGVWRVAYNPFISVRQDEKAAVLLDGDEERRLFESSKLAQALIGVEAARPRLMVFFYVLYPVRLPRGDGRIVREMLTGDVVYDAFSEFVRMILPNVIKDRYKGDRSKKE
jgi:HD superfamily phosphohydrolase